MDSIPSCLNIGIAVPSQQHSVETEKTLQHAASKREMNTTNDLLKPQVGEYQNAFAAFNDPTGEQTSSSGEDWQTMLSRAGIPGIPRSGSGITNAFPMFESDANQLLAPGNIPHFDDVGMGDFGWLDDHTVDWNAVLDPELAKEDHLARMADIAAGGGAAMESPRNAGDDKKFITWDSVTRAPEEPTEFSHADMDIILDDIPEETPEEQHMVCEDAFGSASFAPEFGYSDRIVGDNVKTSFSPLMVTGPSENMETSEPEDWSLEDHNTTPIMHLIPILQPGFGFSLPRPESSSVEDYICSALAPPHAVSPIVSQSIAHSASPPPGSIMQHAYNVNVPGSDLKNVDGDMIEEVELPTQHELDAMIIDVDISTVVLPCPTAISIKPQFSAKTTSSHSGYVLGAPEPDTRINAGGAMTRPVIEKMDDDMIDMPLETLATICVPSACPSSPSGRDNNECIKIPSTPGNNQIGTVSDDAPELSMSDTHDEPAASNISTVPVLDTGEYIRPPFIQNDLSFPSPSVALNNHIEQVADDAPEISMPDAHDEPVASNMSTILVPDTHAHINTPCSLNTSSSPTPTAVPDNQMEQVANSFLEAPILDDYNKQVELGVFAIPVHELMSAPSSPNISSSPSPSVAPVDRIELVADNSLDAPIESHHEPPASNSSNSLVLSKETQLESTELNHETTVMRSIRVAAQVENRQTRKDADRREWKDRKEGMLIRKLTSQIHDLSERRVERERVEDERTQFYCGQIAALKSQLEEQKSEEARSLNELQSRQEVEIGMLRKELEAMKAKAIELRKESERKDVEHARKRVEWEKAIREDERKMVRLRDVEAEKAMTEVYKTLETPRVTWDNWPKKAPGKVGPPTPVPPGPMKDMVKKVILQVSTPPASITVGRETKTIELPPTRLKVTASPPTLQWHLINTLGTPYSVTLASVLIAASGPGQLAIPYSVLGVVMLMMFMWLSVRWNRRSRLSGYISDVKRPLVPLAKGLLFAFTATILTGLSWLKAIALAPISYSNLDTDTAKNLGSDRMWDELPEVRVHNAVPSTVSSPVWRNLLENVRTDVILHVQDPVMIPAENGECNNSEGCRDYERLGDMILGPQQQPSLCQRYHLALGSGEVETVVKQWVPEEMGLNDNVRIGGVPGTEIGIGYGALALVWAVGVYRMLVVRNRR